MIEIVPARPQHIRPIANRMRPNDVAECVVSGMSPVEALRTGLVGSSLVWTAKVDDRPEVMFGVTPLSMIEGRGRIWMLGTDAIDRYPKEVFRLARRYTEAIQSQYLQLENHIPAHEGKTLRWLSRLGFAIGPVDVYNGQPIRGFIRCASRPQH